MIGFVICHKSLAFELVHTTHAILGHHDDLYPFSNDKLTEDELLKKLQHLKESKSHDQNMILMVDLRGGNCWRIAKIFSHDHPGSFVLSGVNLPMLFSFLTKKDHLNSKELAETLLKDAHRGVELER